MIPKRAALLRSWLYQRPEKSIALVSHGAFLHYLMEDWTGFDDKKGELILLTLLTYAGTAFFNCEMRVFNFSKDSTNQSAHIVETEESKASRPKVEERDPHVLDQMP